MEAGSISNRSLSSYFRQQRCGGGNLIKIHTDQCKVSSAGKQQCNVTVTGIDTFDTNTRFAIAKIRGKKCIQFTKRDGTIYALKVINGTNLTFQLIFEEHDGCSNTTDDEFLFVERKDGKIFKYEHTVASRTMCLGVTSDCTGKLYLLSPDNTSDRRCSFKRLI
ncbi:hypothetical protein ACROYT_G026005 [Oculina patagonica]